MKFTHTLHINAKEIEVLNEAMKMYRAHYDKKWAEKDFTHRGATLEEKGFRGYRCKVVNMAKVFEEIKTLPKPEVSEKGKIPEDMLEQTKA